MFIIVKKNVFKCIYTLKMSLKYINLNFKTKFIQEMFVSTKCIHYEQTNSIIKECITFISLRENIIKIICVSESVWRHFK